MPTTKYNKKAIKLVDIVANEDNVTNIAHIKYNIFNTFSIVNFLNVKKSYIQPKKPVYFPSLSFFKNVKYNTMPPTIANTKDTIIQLKDSLIEKQNIKINYLSNSYEEMKRYASASELARNRLEDNLNKSKKKTKIITGVAGAFASAFLVLLLVK